MQKHKKYLVITIWISTIAFVGAGFVGWGAYKFGSGADAVAKVGDVKISYKELNQKYSRLYQYYNQLLGGKLDNAKAKELGLEKEALRELISQALFENYAKDMGLMVSDEEVAKKIASMPVFFNKNGTFDKKIYLQVLANNRLKPKDFEQEIKKELLIQKLQRSLPVKLFDLEFDTVGTSLFIADKIEYKPLDSQNLTVVPTEDELLAYYKKNKNKFLSPYRFQVATLEVDPKSMKIDKSTLKKYYEDHRLKYEDQNGKVLSFNEAKDLVYKDLQRKKAKKEALKKYIMIKKGSLKPQKEILITDQDKRFPPQLIQTLKKANPSTVLKPVFIDNRYVVIKLLKKEPPQPLPFHDAKAKVEAAFIQEKKRTLLLEMAQKELKNFQGTQTDFICRDDSDKLSLLTSEEATLFLNKLFTQEKNKGIIKLNDDKVVLYKVIDQKLGKREKIDKNRPIITDNSLRLKTNSQFNGILKKLEDLYEIKIYKGF